VIISASRCIPWFIVYLDPQKYDKPPLKGELIGENPNWKLLKDALQVAGHTSRSPIMCNGGKKDSSRIFKCKLCNRLYRPKLFGKKDGAPRDNADCINMDKGGRHPEGKSQSKRTRTTQALTKDRMCSFAFTVKWDLFGFYITVPMIRSGCPNHDNHPKSDLSKLTLPMQLIPDRGKEILQSIADALEPLLGVIMFSPNLASSSRRLKYHILLLSPLSH
jgi:hypothetical protein